MVNTFDLTLDKMLFNYHVNWEDFKLQLTKKRKTT